MSLEETEAFYKRELKPLTAIEKVKYILEKYEYLRTTPASENYEEFKKTTYLASKLSNSLKTNLRVIKEKGEINTAISKYLTFLNTIEIKPIPGLPTKAKEQQQLFEKTNEQLDKESDKFMKPPSRETWKEIEALLPTIEERTTTEGAGTKTKTQGAGTKTETKPGTKTETEAGPEPISPLETELREYEKQYTTKYTTEQGQLFLELRNTLFDPFTEEETGVDSTLAYKKRIDNIHSQVINKYPNEETKEINIPKAEKKAESKSESVEAYQEEEKEAIRTKEYPTEEAKPEEPKPEALKVEDDDEITITDIPEEPPETEEPSEPEAPETEAPQQPSQPESVDLPPQSVIPSSDSIPSYEVPAGTRTKPNLNSVLSGIDSRTLTELTENRKAGMSIKKLKEDIKNFHQIYDNVIPQFKSKEHQARYKQAIKSNNKRLIMEHYREMEQAIANYYKNDGGFKLGVIISAESLFDGSIFGKGLSTLSATGFQESQQPVKVDRSSMERGGLKAFENVKDIKPSYTRGGIDHFYQKPVANRLIRTKNTITPKEKQIPLPPTQPKGPYNHILRRPIKPDVSNIKFKTKKYK